MNILIELLLWIFVAPIIEIGLYALAELLKKKKHKTVKTVKYEKIIDHDSFVMKFDKESKGLAGVLGGLMCICCLSGLIPIFLIYKKNEMGFSDFMIGLLPLMSMLLATVFLILKVFLFKVYYKNKIFCKYSLLRIKKIYVENVDYRIVTKKQIVLYKQNKKVLKLSAALTNFNVAREICAGKENEF